MATGEAQIRRAGGQRKSVYGRTRREVLRRLREARWLPAQAAADLVWEQGVAGVSLADVRAATGTSKSQLYHYFADKAALLREVVALQSARNLEAQRPALDRLDSWAALERWCDEIVAAKASQDCRGSCRIGSLVTQLAETDPAARTELAAAFERWEGYLAAGLDAMQRRGILYPRGESNRAGGRPWPACKAACSWLKRHARRDPCAWPSIPRFVTSGAGQRCPSWPSRSASGQKRGKCLLTDVPRHGLFRAPDSDLTALRANSGERMRTN